MRGVQETVLYEEAMDLKFLDEVYGISGGVMITHFLEVLVAHVGLDRTKAAVKHPVTGFRVAPHNGCQIVRTFGIDDYPDNPMMMDRLVETMGVIPAYCLMKVMCCGGSLVDTRH
jgi:heterodisulfide reductase subunit B